MGMNNRDLNGVACACLAALSATTLLLGGCGQSASTAKSPTPAATSAPIAVYASIQELMEAIIDPAADGIWESVGTTLTQKETVNYQPRTDEEWKQVRLHTIALMEATNLLAMEGRRLVPVGGKILDEGADGVLSTAEAETLLKTDHATFVQFARALNDVSGQMLKAIDAKQPEAMMTAGEAMDGVCEGCHTKFWYPHQIVWKVSKSEPNAAR
jgi:hypothetical protein